MEKFIEIKRTQLLLRSKQLPLTGPQVIKLSQELDRLIYSYLEISKHKKLTS